MLSSSLSRITGQHALLQSDSSLPSRTTAGTSTKVVWSSSSELSLMPSQTNAVPEQNVVKIGCSKVESFEGASGDTQTTLNPYLIELVRNTVREEVEECEERLRRSVLHLHAEMLKQFHMQQVIFHS